MSEPLVIVLVAGFELMALSLVTAIYYYESIRGAVQGNAERRPKRHSAPANNRDQKQSQGSSRHECTAIALPRECTKQNPRRFAQRGKIPARLLARVRKPGSHRSPAALGRTPRLQQRACQ